MHIWTFWEALRRLVENLFKKIDVKVIGFVNNSDEKKSEAKMRFWINSLKSPEESQHVSSNRSCPCFLSNSTQRG